MPLCDQQHSDDRVSHLGGHEERCRPTVRRLAHPYLLPHRDQQRSNVSVAVVGCFPESGPSCIILQLIQDWIMEERRKDTRSGIHATYVMANRVDGTRTVRVERLGVKEVCVQTSLFLRLSL